MKDRKFLTERCFTAAGICHNMPPSPPRVLSLDYYGYHGDTASPEGIKKKKVSPKLARRFSAGRPGI